MDQSVRSEPTPRESAEEWESDLVDLTGVPLAPSHGLCLPTPPERLLIEVRRPRSTSTGGQNPGRAE